MLKNITKLEHKIGERVYQFVCENDAPLGECHDALAKFKGYVVDRIKEASEAEKPRRDAEVEILKENVDG